jgi:hypothetical protein
MRLATEKLVLGSGEVTMVRPAKSAGSVIGSRLVETPK